MKLTLRSDLGGYALAALSKTSINGTVLDKPFVLFTGPNGSGKSAILRGIRASLGLRGERAGHLDTPMRRHIETAQSSGDLDQLATQTQNGDGKIKPADHVPAVFSLHDLGWKGQPTYLFDSRAASTIANASSFDEDMMYHMSLIVGGGAKVSHGQFITKTWQEALHWGSGLISLDDPWLKGYPSSAHQAARDPALDGDSPSQERWLFIDEPETAIDAETLLIGLATLLHVAEVGKLRIFCASHSFLFAAGLIDHPKIQTIDLGPNQSWIDTQRIALRVAGDPSKLESIGIDILQRMHASQSRK